MTELSKIETACRSHCEGSDTYHSVTVRSEKYRVIVCKDNWQWVIQKRAGTRHGQPRWEGFSYCRGRNALIRLWTGLHRRHVRQAWPELDALPEKFRGDT